MKLWIDLCALCLSAGKINHAFSRSGETRETGKNPLPFGSFSVRLGPPAVKKVITYNADQNLVFRFQECWSAYSKLNALKAVWNRPGVRWPRPVAPSRTFD
jgi:hypothetical protein